MSALIWFKQDLRLFDNQAVSQAWAHHDTVIAAITLTEETWATHDWAPIKRDFYLRRLNVLGEELAALSVPLYVLNVGRYEHTAGALCKFAKEHDVTHLYFNRELPFDERKREAAVSSWLEKHEVQVHISDDVVAVPPEQVKTGQGDFYKKFTPFYRTWLKVLSEHLPTTPNSLAAKGPACQFSTIESSGNRKDSSAWKVNSDDVLAQLDEFIEERVEHYDEARDAPNRDGTSSLSAHLEAGVIGVKTVFRRLQTLSPDFPFGLNKGAETWLSEIAWRDFYQHLMWHVPRLSQKRAFQPETDHFEWENDQEKFEAWCCGKTGVPIVDAGMRQLNQTGWMHNRLRMIVASFLVKDLLIDWRWGEKYFMSNLIDGSFPANNGGWQWSASTGTDAVPYFRVFNPYRQSERFDPEGKYIRRWVEELVEVPSKYIHEPHEYLKRHKSSSKYPAPIVNHAQQRDLFLTKFKRVRNDS